MMLSTLPSTDTQRHFSLTNERFEELLHTGPLDALFTAVEAWHQHVLTTRTNAENQPKRSWRPSESLLGRFILHQAWAAQTIDPRLLATMVLLIAGGESLTGILFNAVDHGRDNIIPVLIAHGANVNEERTGRSALFTAVRQGRLTTVQALVDAGALARSPNDPLGHNVINGLLTSERHDTKNDAAIVHRLVESTLVDLHGQSGPFEETLLHQAIRHVREDLVEVLVALGADLQRLNAHGQNAWSLALKTWQDMLQHPRWHGAIEHCNMIMSLLRRKEAEMLLSILPDDQVLQKNYNRVRL